MKPTFQGYIIFHTLLLIFLLMLQFSYGCGSGFYRIRIILPDLDLFIGKVNKEIL